MLSTLAIILEMKNINEGIQGLCLSIISKSLSHRLLSRVIYMCVCNTNNFIGNRGIMNGPHLEKDHYA
jgi:hypothetical protein